MPEYINHNSYPVHLAGPDGRIIRLASQQRMVLSQFFEQYRNRGMIRLASEGTRLSPQVNISKHIVPTPRRHPRTPKPVELPRQEPPKEDRISPDPKRNNLEEAKKAIARRDAYLQKVRTVTTPGKPVVGKQVRGDATEELRSFLQSNSFAISNDIGVGILSYNRAASLKRCITSILAHTDLNRTTVFISDDGSSDSHTIAYIEELSKDPRFVVLANRRRIGIAGNTNRLLNCLQRFKYALLLNDDVQVISDGWDQFYFDSMKRTGFKHFIHRENGVYGAQPGKSVSMNGVDLAKVDDKPQGAILALHTDCIENAGYFDESFGLYGMEHVDWSTKVYEVGLQPQGFFDVVGSSRYFKLHPEQSAVEDRSALLAAARIRFSQRSTTIAKPSNLAAVDAVSVVVPYRELQRNVSLGTVLNNLKALRVPQVEILLVEQDAVSKVSGVDLSRIVHKLVPNGEKPLFNKSMAFNNGVHIAKHDKILMHDADILAATSYGPDILARFATSDAFHIGSVVLYANPDGTESINSRQTVTPVPCDRIVGYFEGGSLAATKKAYWSIGGFNESFYGYGCEDCDFFARLSSLKSFFNERTHKFLHLWHPRAENWGDHHDFNRALERRLCAMPMEDRIRGLKNQVDKYAV